jgi:hypothetical protein
VSLAEDATRLAVLEALRDLAEAEYQAARSRVLDGLRAARAELALKSLRVTPPHGTPVATITLTDPRPAVIITDPDAFTAWVTHAYPTEVEMLVRVRPGWQQQFLAAPDASADPVTDPRTGGVIPGLAVLPAAEPRSFSLRPVPGGMEQIARAWHSGVLDLRRLLTLEAGAE